MSDASKKVDEYNAMTIASVNKQVFILSCVPTHIQNHFQGFPSARMVPLKKSKPTKDLDFSQIMAAERLVQIHIIFGKTY